MSSTDAKSTSLHHAIRNAIGIYDGTTPLDADSDDGLTDDFELSQGLNFMEANHDNDGLSDDWSWAAPRLPWVLT